MRPLKRVCLAVALTLVSVQLLAPSAQSQSGTKPSPREPIVEDTRAAPYLLASGRKLPPRLVNSEVCSESRSALRRKKLWGGSLIYWPIATARW
jgi:hypothetical protein